MITISVNPDPELLLDYAQILKHDLPLEDFNDDRLQVGHAEFTIPGKVAEISTGALLPADYEIHDSEQNLGGRPAGGDAGGPAGVQEPGGARRRAGWIRQDHPPGRGPDGGAAGDGRGDGAFPGAGGGRDRGADPTTRRREAGAADQKSAGRLRKPNQRSPREQPSTLCEAFVPEVAAADRVHANDGECKRRRHGLQRQSRPVRLACALLPPSRCLSCSAHSRAVASFHLFSGYNYGSHNEPRNRR